MKTSVPKRYQRWASFRPAGYGAQPHGYRLEGYPTDHANPSGTATAEPQGAYPSQPSHSRDGSLRAMDAASRPENMSPFLPLYADTALQ